MPAAEYGLPRCAAVAAAAQNCVELGRLAPSSAPTHAMRLNVAVQMDPIERINIRGDSTFALAAGSAARGSSAVLLHARPARAARRQGSATVRPLERARQSPAIISRSASRATSICHVRRRAAAPGPAVRPRLHHHDAHARTHPPEDAGGQRSGPCAQRAGKNLRHRISRPDAADADHPRPRRHQGVPRRARRHRHEAALRQRRRSGVPADAAKTSISARCSICSPPCSASRGWCRNSCPR